MAARRGAARRYGAGGTARPHSISRYPHTCFETIDEMQVALDEYLATYKRKRPHQGRGMSGRTTWHAFRGGLPNDANTTTIKPEEERGAA